MVNRMLAVVTFVLLLGFAYAFAQDPGEPDTLRISTVQVDPGNKAVLELTFFNDEELNGMQVPLKYYSPDITVDSISYENSRLDYIGIQIKTYDEPNQQVMGGMIILFEEPLQPGDGRFCTIHFDIPTGIDDQRIAVDTLTFAGTDKPLFIISAVQSFAPVVKPGEIIVGNPPDPPIIGISQESFSFEAMSGANLPDPEVLVITNEGGDVMDWEITWNESWLDVLPSFGSTIPATPSNIQIVVTTTNLAPGIYNDVLTITAEEALNSPIEIPVEYIVTVPPPTIEITPTEFIFNAVVGEPNPPSQTLNISNVGLGTLNWIVSNQESWLNLTPTSGTGDGQVEVAVDISGLDYGTYEDIIVVSDPDATNDPQEALVRLEVASDLPILAVDTSHFYVIAHTEFPSDRKFNIFNAGGGSMNFYLEENSSYIILLDPMSGTVPEEVTVSFKTIGGPIGTDVYETVWVHSDEAINSPIPVVFQIHFTDDPAYLQVSENSVMTEFVECGQGVGFTEFEMLVNVSTNNYEPVPVELSHKSDWLELSTTSGITPVHCMLYLEYRGLEPGIYRDTIVVLSQQVLNSPQKIPIKMTITPTVLTPELYLSDDYFFFIARENRDVAPKDITINNVYPGCIDWQLTEGIPWLSFSVDSSDNKTYPWIGEITLDTEGMLLGEYTGAMTIVSNSASNTPITINTELAIWRFYGDNDFNGIINLLDIVYLIDYKFKGGPPPKPVFYIGDVNCDLLVDILDIADMITYKFHYVGPLCGNPY